jgi:hypothetical protein
MNQQILASVCRYFVDGMLPFWCPAHTVMVSTPNYSMYKVSACTRSVHASAITAATTALAHYPYSADK